MLLQECISECGCSHMCVRLCAGVCTCVCPEGRFLSCICRITGSSPCWGPFPRWQEMLAPLGLWLCCSRVTRSLPKVRWVCAVSVWLCTPDRAAPALTLSWKESRGASCSPERTAGVHGMWKSTFSRAVLHSWTSFPLSFSAEMRLCALYPSIAG